MSSTLATLRERLEAAIADVDAAELPDVIGVLAAATARAELRLRTTAPATASAPVDEMVTAAELARRFRLSISTINELSRQNRLPHRMFGRYRRFNLAEVAEHLANSKRACVGAGGPHEKTR